VGSVCYVAFEYTRADDSEIVLADTGEEETEPYGALISLRQANVTNSSV